MKENFPKIRGAERLTEGPDGSDKEALFLDILRKTGKIEAHLERTALVEGIEEALDKRTLPAGIHKGALVRSLAAGIFALGLQVGDVFAQTGVEKPPLTQEQITTLEKVTGMPFAELSTSFTVEMPVKPGEGGMYIIHIGQTHQPPTEGFSRLMTNGIVGSVQRKLEPLILGIYKANNIDGVFEEGIAYSDSMPYIKERIQYRMTEIANALADTPFTIEKIEKVIVSLTEVTYPIALVYIGEALDSLIKEYRAVLPTLKPSSTEDTGSLKKIEMLLKLYDLRKGLNLFQSSDDKYVTAGALRDLYIRGEINNIYPAETVEANEHTMSMIKNEDVALEAYNKKRDILRTQLETDPYFVQLEKDLDSRFASASKNPDGTIVEQERGPLGELLKSKMSEEDAFFELNLREEKEALGVAKVAFNKSAHDERNRVLLRLIEDHDLSRIRQGLHLQNVAVVYGSNHDFTKAVVDQHQGNSPHRVGQRGLIKITPKTTN